MNTLEICCYSATSAIKAAEAGANRIELCENFTEGGTTPSYGTIKYVLDRVKIPVNVILRPRGGDFLYNNAEFEVMKQDVLKIKKLGANGVVFGMLTASGDINIKQVKEIKELASPLECTFHRAFDMCNDMFKALQQLKEIGIQKVLTSGGKNTAYEGIDVLEQLVVLAKNDIIIMPGSGINDKNIKEIYIKTKAKEYHASCKTFEKSDMTYFNPNIQMGKNKSINEYQQISVNTSQIKKILTLL
ncbi:copper homeostasis protein CutC [Wenyingzhuangia marina]|uniref:PF03932 family protein CutC n=1 Tax=Wenyingzhuangia marina TaxID=1195760 RepID=A0A1M5U6R1_9FLAO|nr:copper homeostasis protein CutC [Wenyingzhuangia marina]GGF69317.1 copper homeostasis protein CutC [Wenyingzhuangia marina]SHH58590.1 copper homeostasis protein [Wenyingzhuangia marina]